MQFEQESCRDSSGSPLESETARAARQSCVVPASVIIELHSPMFPAASMARRKAVRVKKTTPTGRLLRFCLD